jgi:hypothetical protein
MWIIGIMLSVSYALGALLTLKLDASLAERPTEYNLLNLILSTLFWWFIAILLLTTKHDCSLKAYFSQEGRHYAEIHSSEYDY